MNAVEQKTNQLLRVVLVEALELCRERRNTSLDIMRTDAVPGVTPLVPRDGPARAVRVRLVDKKIERFGELALASERVVGVEVLLVETT